MVGLLEKAIGGSRMVPVTLRHAAQGEWDSASTCDRRPAGRGSARRRLWRGERAARAYRRADVRACLQQAGTNWAEIPLSDFGGVVFGIDFGRTRLRST